MWSDRNNRNVNFRDLEHHLCHSLRRACASSSCDVEQAVCVPESRYPPAHASSLASWRTKYHNTQGCRGLFNVPDAASSWLDEGPRTIPPPRQRGNPSRFSRYELWSTQRYHIGMAPNGSVTLKFPLNPRPLHCRYRSSRSLARRQDTSIAAVVSR